MIHEIMDADQTRILRIGGTDGILGAGESSKPLPYQFGCGAGNPLAYGAAEGNGIMGAAGVAMRLYRGSNVTRFGEIGVNIAALGDAGRPLTYRAEAGGEGKPINKGAGVVHKAEDSTGHKAGNGDDGIYKVHDEGVDPKVCKSAISTD